jgi:hypothetical protein
VRHRGTTNSSLTIPPCPFTVFRSVRSLTQDRFEEAAPLPNHLSKLVESYRLATTQPPPAGYALVHNRFEVPRRKFERSGSFRAWWAMPGPEFILCACGWRADLGEHYRVQRVGPLIARPGRPNGSG